MAAKCFLWFTVAVTALVAVSWAGPIVAMGRTTSGTYVALETTACLAPADTSYVYAAWNVVSDGAGVPAARYALEWRRGNPPAVQRRDTVTLTTAQYAVVCPAWGDSTRVDLRVRGIDVRGTAGAQSTSNVVYVRVRIPSPLPAPQIRIDTIPPEVAGNPESEIVVAIIGSELVWTSLPAATGYRLTLGPYTEQVPASISSITIPASTPAGRITVTALLDSGDGPSGFVDWPPSLSGEGRILYDANLSALTIGEEVQLCYRVDYEDGSIGLDPDIPYCRGLAGVSMLREVRQVAFWSQGHSVVFR